MYIFFSILILIIGIIFFIIGLQKYKQNLIKIENAKKLYLETKLQDLIKTKESLEKQHELLQIKRDAILREYKTEQQHLEELKTHTRELLLTEKERLESELNAMRALKLEQLKREYEAKSNVLEEHYLQHRNEIDTEIAKCEETLQQFRSMQAATNEAILRQKELEENELFYSIDVSENDREDISILQSMDARLHNRDVIPKLIWELFIRRPTQEMIKRVVGNEKISGIYKITNKNTGEAYIGRTTDFATRFSNHVKTAIGLEAAAKSTLHNRMGKDGIWNYTFEIIEQVNKDNLASRESYYIDLYGTKNQLNMKSGDKNGTQ